MPAAFLPSPAKGSWHLGPLVVHGSALCVVLGIGVAIWVTERRYRAAGGRAWMMLDVATVAVPAALLGAVLYRLATGFGQYVGHGRDWVDIFRIPGSGTGLPGAVITGLAVAWLWSRRRGAALGPILAAAAPALALGAAIAVCGHWFAQTLYGLPSTWPWAVEISPGHRLGGYQSFGTFQPLFLYDCVWDVLLWLMLSYAIRRLAMTGDRALALCAGVYAIGWLGTEELRPGPAPHSVPLVIALLALIAAAAGYLFVTRARRGPEPLTRFRKVRQVRRVRPVGQRRLRGRPLGGSEPARDIDLAAEPVKFGAEPTAPGLGAGPVSPRPADEPAN